MSVMAKLWSHCGRTLTIQGGVEICLACNQMAFPTEVVEQEKVVIECPGVTLYDVESGDVLQGVRWLDPADPAKGYELVGQPLYAPNHRARRLILPDQAGKITRCQACQDYTVRMRAQQRTQPVKNDGPSPARRRAEDLFRD